MRTVFVSVLITGSPHSAGFDETVSERTSDAENFTLFVSPAMKKSADFSNESLPRSPSLLHETTERAAATSRSVLLKNPFIIFAFTKFRMLKNPCKDTKKRHISQQRPS